MSFIKAILLGHVINQGRKIYNGRHTCLTKENNLGLQQSAAMELLQIATAQFITKCDGQLLQIATGITKCDGFITNCDSTRRHFVNFNACHQRSYHP